MAADAFLELFARVDPGDDDGPELHLAGLAGDDLDTWFAPLGEHGASATPFVEGVRVGGTVLPRFSFFAYAHVVELFWYPGEGLRWDAAAVDGLVELLRRFRERVPDARIVPDPRFVEHVRQDLATALAERFGADAVALA